MAVPLLLNVTICVGVPNPPVTAAVKVTGWFTLETPGDELRITVAPVPVPLNAILCPA